jgi:hypothetical protein
MKSFFGILEIVYNFVLIISDQSANFFEEIISDLIIGTLDIRP